MIRPTQVWLVGRTIDMRAGIDSLSQRIQNTLGRSPCDGSAYAFRNRRLQSDQTADLGRHRRLAVPSTTAPRAFRLAHLGCDDRAPSPPRNGDG